MRGAPGITWDEDEMLEWRKLINMDAVWETGYIILVYIVLEE